MVVAIKRSLLELMAFTWLDLLLLIQSLEQSGTRQVVQERMGQQLPQPHLCHTLNRLAVNFHLEINLLVGS